MSNIIVLWQTVYLQAALDHLVANGYPLDPADIARLSPLGHPHDHLYLDFSVLAPICAEFRQRSFLCVIAPLRLAGATGSPVNPIAIL